MPDEVIEFCSHGTPPPKGWYRVATGRLRYWNGSTRSGSTQIRAHTPAPAPIEPDSTPSSERRIWAATTVMAVGWIALIMFLGLAISDVHGAGVECGRLFSPLGDLHDNAEIACRSALGARALVTAATAVVAVLCFLGPVAAPRLMRRIRGRSVGHWLRCVPIWC